MTGPEPRQDNATLTEELLAAADELDLIAECQYDAAAARQATLIRTVLADHAESSFGACATCQYAMSQWPCPTRIAVADCFLSSRSTVPGVTK